MATHILTTAANMTAVTFSPAATVLLPADQATVSQLIKDDINPAHPVYPNPSGGFVPEGRVFVPNRGWLKVLPGDVVAVDLNGNVIVVSAYSIAQGNAWTLV